MMPMRSRMMYVLILATAASAAVSQHPRLREWRRNTVSPRAAGGAVASATIGQIRHRPREWTGAGGFAKRVGSGFATHVVEGTIQTGVAAIHHENLHYQRSNLDGRWPRVKYAVKSTFIVPRTNRKGKTVALGRISGGMGAGMISRTWQPASAAGVGAGLASGGIAIGADVGANVAREFWPHKGQKRARAHGPVEHHHAAG
jgi:hypothetical protein